MCFNCKGVYGLADVRLRLPLGTHLGTESRQTLLFTRNVDANVELAAALLVHVNVVDFESMVDLIVRSRLIGLFNDPICQCGEQFPFDRFRDMVAN